MEADYHPAGHIAYRGNWQARLVRLRWTIGTFHKILESGCKAEESPVHFLAFPKRV